MPIPNSNLILLVKDLNCPLIDDGHYKMSSEPEEYKYKQNDTEIKLTCHKVANPLYRRRPASCINQNKNVCY